MSQTDRRLLSGTKVLVTGANGYIASHIIDVLLEEGYNVRGTIRSEKPWLDQFFEDKYGKGRFETVILPDLTDQAAFESVLHGISGVIHSATDVSFKPDPERIVPSVVAGTINALRAAAKHHAVKSFVLTSSSTAALLPERGKNRVVVDENTWNDASLDAAFDPDTPKDQLPFIVYSASKTAGERALWKWVNEEKPHFVVNTVLPNANWGAILSPHIGGSTMNWIRRLLEGDETFVKYFPPQFFVNVRDDARIHVAALLDPAVKSERLFAFAKDFNWTDVIQILRKLRPDNKMIPDPPQNEGRDLSDLSKPIQRAEKLLQSFYGLHSWTSLEASIADGIIDLK